MYMDIPTYYDNTFLGVNPQHFFNPQDKTKAKQGLTLVMVIWIFVKLNEFIAIQFLYYYYIISGSRNVLKQEMHCHRNNHGK